MSASPVDVPFPDFCWPVTWGCVSPDEVDAIPEDVRRFAEAQAVQTLRVLTLYQVGGCDRVVRPCSASCGQGWSPTINERGNWVNVSCGCGAPSPCGCGSAPVVLLGTPVGRVSQVVIDGVELDPSAYRVDDGGRLIRTDGDPWPSCQDFSKNLGEDGTFSVSYLNAYPVDGIGSWVAGRLAWEFVKSCRGEKCALPAGVTQLARQGVTMDIRTDMFSDGLTGIREVDNWTAKFNPSRFKRKPAVYTPDVPQHRYTVVK